MVHQNDTQNPWIYSLDMELSDKPIMLTPSPCTLSSGRGAPSIKRETVRGGDGGDGGNGGDGDKQSGS